MDNFFELNLFDHVPIGLCAFLSDFEVIYWNRCFEEWSNIPREEIEGKSLLEVFPHLKNKGYFSRIQQVINGSPPAFFSSKLHRSMIPCSINDQKEMALKYQLSKMRSPRVDQDILVLSAEDVTDNETHVQAYKEMTTKAEIASQTKGQFLATMSHEIRTPMNGVLGCANLLFDTVKDKDNRHLVSTIIKSGETLLTLINDILDFSKIEAGKFELEEIDFHLKTCVEEVIELLLPKANEKKIQLCLNIDPKISPWIKSDLTRIKQILLNLISNAVKFSSEGEIQINIDLDSIEDQIQHLQLSVKDNGVGIPQEVQSKLFQPFSQVDASTTRKFGGTGLGLAICQGLTEAMGGRIWFESEEGKGATFFFTVSCEKAEPHQEEKSQSSVLLTQDMAEQMPMRILIAEDNQVNQMVAKKFLSKLGYRTDIVANGSEALKATEEKSYDILFMDCHMPEMDGFEATTRICQKWSKNERPKIFALTASAMKEDIQKCFDSGMDGFVSKPVNLKELARALREANQLIQENQETQEGEVSMESQQQQQLQSIDLSRLQENFSGAEEILDHVITSFLEFSPQGMTATKTAVEQKDFSELEIAAHTLKGAASNLAATSVAQTCDELENLAKSGDMSKLTELVNVLDSQLSQLQQDLQSLLSKAS